MTHFNALTGSELIKVVQDAIGVAMEKSGEFNNHTTFPWVKYSFQVKVLAYPQQDVKEEPKIRVSGQGQSSEEPPETRAVEMEVDVSDVIIDTPDLARVTASLPVPTVAPQAGVLVDKMVKKGAAKK